MTAMIAAPVSQTTFATPASVKLISRPAGSIASMNDAASTQSPSARLNPATVTCGLWNRGRRGNASGDCVHEYIVRSLHYTKQTDWI